MADGQRLSAALAYLTGLVVGEQTLTHVLDQVVALSVQAISEVDAAAVTWVGEDKPTTTSVSDDLARRVDELQYQLGEGPCLQAHDRQTVIHAPELRTDARWPRLGPRAADAGAAAALAIPLTVRSVPLGALNLYSRMPRTLDDSVAAAATLFAEYAGQALANAHAFTIAQTTMSTLQAAISSRSVIDEAKGILMERHQCDADQAFELLRQASASQHIKLRDVAQQIVDTITGCGSDPTQHPGP